MQGLPRGNPWPGSCSLRPWLRFSSSHVICLHFSGGISVQSLPSTRKRRAACPPLSGDARESRKRRGLRCAPAPWIA